VGTRHLVWDWNGTLLDDLTVVVAASNAAFVHGGGEPIDADRHRREYRRPLVDFYSAVLGRPLAPGEFDALEDVFYRSYRAQLLSCGLAADAVEAINSWEGTQSLLSMYHHDRLIPEVTRHGLVERLLRIDGRRDVADLPKEGLLRSHLASLELAGPDVVLIGDSVDDARAAVAVGAACVLYAGGFTHPEVLAATGHPVAHTLVEAVSLAG